VLFNDLGVEAFMAATFLDYPSSKSEGSGKALANVLGKRFSLRQPNLSPPGRV
jgi:hypothetical protein